MRLHTTETILTTTSGSATGSTYSTPVVAQGGTVKFQAHLAGTGAVSVTVVLQVTNTPATTTSWMDLATISLSGTTTAVDGYATVADWPCVRAKTTAISGTGATVVVTMGV